MTHELTTIQKIENVLQKVEDEAHLIHELETNLIRVQYLLKLARERMRGLESELIRLEYEG